MNLSVTSIPVFSKVLTNPARIHIQPLKLSPHGQSKQLDSIRFDLNSTFIIRHHYRDIWIYCIFSSLMSKTVVREKQRKQLKQELLWLNLDRGVMSHYFSTALLYKYKQYKVCWKVLNIGVLWIRALVITDGNFMISWNLGRSSFSAKKVGLWFLVFFRYSWNTWFSMTFFTLLQMMKLSEQLALDTQSRSLLFNQDISVQKAISTSFLFSCSSYLFKSQAPNVTFGGSGSHVSLWPLDQKRE